MYKTFIGFLLALFVMVLANQGKAEMLSQISLSPDTQDITIGKKLKITSKLLGEEREIFVYQPEKMRQKIPLLIVFDAESLFLPLVSAVNFMNYSSEMPQISEMLVVGIPNTKRDRDMPVPQQYDGLRENRFFSFLEKELLPFLRQNYQLSDITIAVGHSQGGLFVTNMMVQNSQLFTWAIALDAPMNVTPKIDPLKQTFSNKINQNSTPMRYVSVENTYGWGDDWATYKLENKNTLQIKSENEDHESMPYKGIYDGLKFLFNGFTPVRKELKLEELKKHYQSLSAVYGYEVNIPLQILLVSARRKLIENRKDEILELLSYAEEKYGASESISVIKSQAENIQNDTNPRLIDSYLNLPKPSKTQIKPYLGKWKGETIVPNGNNMPMDWEITIEGEKVMLLTSVPWDKNQRVEPEIFSVNDKNELIVGRRNRGGGVFVTVLKIGENQILSGEERILGFSIQPNWTDEMKKQVELSIKNANKVMLNKIQ